MTVAELRKKLEGLSGDAEVLIEVCPERMAVGLKDVAIAAFPGFLALRSDDEWHDISYADGPWPWKGSA